MKPNFALSLSFDGIRLLHRSKKGWSEVGDVTLESHDLAGDLAALRAIALEIAPDGMRTKLIIPDAQIKYLDLPRTDLGPADVRAALEGVTPYAVDELSFDFAEDGERTCIAAVANETLEEAESFAVEHDLGPVSFVAAPHVGAFPKEPFFGKTQAAGSTRVMRDKTPVPLVPAETEPASEVARPEAVAAEVPEAHVRPDDAPGDETSDAPAASPVLVDTADDGADDRADHGADDGADDGAASPAADPDDENSSRAEAAPEPVQPAEDAPTEPDEALWSPENAPDEQVEANWSPEVVPHGPHGPHGPATSPEDANQPTPVAEADALHNRNDEPEEAVEAKWSPEDAPDEPDEPATTPEDAREQETVAEVQAPQTPGDELLDEPLEEPAPDPEPTVTSTAPKPATTTEPVFSSRLRAVREELGDNEPPALPPAAARPAAGPPPPTLDAVGRAAPTQRATPTPPPMSAPRTQMPPAVAEALKKAEQREAVPPRLPAADAGPTETGGSAFRSATPPPPAVSKALERVRKGPNLPGLNGAGRVTPVPGAGPQARVTSAAPGLSTAPSRSDVPPPVNPPRAVQDAAERIPAPPAGVAASLKATDGPAGIDGTKGRKSGKSRGLGALFGRGSAAARTQIPAPKPAAKPRPESTTGAAAPGPNEAVKTQSEKDRLTVFGARRRDQEVRGKPRFLGLVLTLILLLIMAAVAAWATLPDGTFARLLGQPELPADALAEDPSAPDVVGSATRPATGTEAAETVQPASPAFEPTPLPATYSPASPGSVPTGDMLLSQGGSLLPDADLLRALAAPTPAAAVSAPPGAVLSPAAAERFYAATGVWLRAPRLQVEPQPEPLGQVTRLQPGATPSFGTPPSLPTAAPDAVLAARVDPPPPDMRFERDARGLLLATPEGTVTPYGMIIYAGSPSIVPPTRPGTPPVLAQGATEPAAEAAAEEDAVAQAGAEDAAPAAVPEQGAVIADATERLESEALAVLEDAPVRPDARISTAGALNAAAISLNGLRPPLRPEDAVPEPLLPEPELARFAGPRPPQRPDDLAPPDAGGAEAPEEELSGGDVDAALAGILAGASDPLATATPNAVAATRRPDSRPNNFARVVQQQQARARQNAPSAPAAAQSDAPSASEPEAVSNASAQPSGPVPQTVASAATLDNAINLRQLNLIGVYGRPSDRRALVRLSNGRYVRVGVGDRLDGGRVAAIENDTLNYVKSGRTVTLQIPSG